MFGKKKQEPAEAGMIYPEPKAGPVFVEFQGASMDYDEETGRLVDMVPRETILINAARIDGFYNHTILIEGRKIRVMESMVEIMKKIEGAIR